MKVDFPFALCQVVKIVAIEQSATIVGVMKDSQGLQYQCVWWVNGLRYNAWLFGHEIE